MSVTKNIRFGEVRFGTLLMVAAAVALLCCNAFSQAGTNGSGTPSWGNYSWQVTSGTVGTAVGTTTFVGSLNFTGTTSPGDVILSVSIPYPNTTTVHEVHGNVAFQVGSGSCGDGAVIAQVRDQSGNTIAGVNLLGLSQSATNVPITATLGTALPVSSLQLQTFTTQCSNVSIFWSLVMS